VTELLEELSELEAELRLLDDNTLDNAELSELDETVLDETKLDATELAALDTTELAAFDELLELFFLPDPPPQATNVVVITNRTKYL
jgi:hypothetical protein